jgi:hypothetical protein
VNVFVKRGRVFLAWSTFQIRMYAATRGDTHWKKTNGPKVKPVPVTSPLSSRARPDVTVAELPDVPAFAVMLTNAEPSTSRAALAPMTPLSKLIFYQE